MLTVFREHAVNSQLGNSPGNRAAWPEFRPNHARRAPACPRSHQPYDIQERIEELVVETQGVGHLVGLGYVGFGLGSSLVVQTLKIIGQRAVVEIEPAQAIADPGGKCLLLVQSVI